jgi:hypothetical protein
VLWDCKTHENTLGINKRPMTQIDFSRQSTKMTVNRELTRDTFKSSTSTRSGTLSSRKSSGKTNEQIDQDEKDKQIPFQQQQQQQTNGKIYNIEKLIHTNFNFF